MRLVRSCMVVCVVAVTVMVPSPVHATYLGENGKISYDRYQSSGGPNIYTIDPDGSDPTLLISNGRYSAWSPDGSRIAYTCDVDTNYTGDTCTAAADGTSINVLDFGNLYPQQRPFWSPDSQRLIIDDNSEVGHNPPEPIGDVWRIDATDGSDHILMAQNATSGSWSPNGRIVYSEFDFRSDRWIGSVDATMPNTGGRLTESGSDISPDQSPDGTRIVFQSYRAGAAGIYVMNANGSSEIRLSTFGSDPVWSPDGTKILFDGGGDLWVMNPDGTGQVNLTNTPSVWERDPAWQPVPQPGYVRPKGATPVRVPLVTAFEQCQSPNRTHGPPLGFGSCAPPDQRAGFMTFGSAPAGSSPKAVGHVRLDVIVGAPDTADNADVGIAVSLTDVRRATDLADGPGGLELQLPIRLTDKDTSGPFVPEQATMQDYTLTFVIPCVETADPSVGSTCSGTTTADALIPPSTLPPFPAPNFVDEGVRAIWELGQISVWDGGDDGYVESRDDNAVLAVQGVFVP